ncbi:MAG: hypothetical protein ACRDQF_15925 [Thermocrispum sp.]
MLDEGELLAHFAKPRKNGDGWLVRCPLHADTTPSLSIRMGDSGWLLHDFAGCATVDILAAAGLKWDDLFRRDRRCR